mmetsp:Transcript_142223/g.442211  ORF Transcript_142223/g.442211 Transcript_142223/m.442211 type:complete len:327 (-) Transcript_142223:999-1979(-)
MRLRVARAQGAFPELPRPGARLEPHVRGVALLPHARELASLARVMDHVQQHARAADTAAHHGAAARPVHVGRRDCPAVQRGAAGGRRRGAEDGDVVAVEPVGHGPPAVVQHVEVQGDAHVVVGHEHLVYPHADALVHAQQADVRVLPGKHAVNGGAVPGRNLRGAEDEEADDEADRLVEGLRDGRLPRRAAGHQRRPHSEAHVCGAGGDVAHEVPGPGLQDEAPVRPVVGRHIVLGAVERAADVVQHEVVADLDVVLAVQRPVAHLRRARLAVGADDPDAEPGRGVHDVAPQAQARPAHAGDLDAPGHRVAEHTVLDHRTRWRVAL